MNRSITVVYLKRFETIDISTEDKMQNAAKKCTNLIAKKIKPLYTIVLMNLYDFTISEQMFREDDAYDAIESSVKRYIYNNVYEYIKENEYIDIEGFIIFRLKSLWDTIDEAVQEYILMKEEYSILTEFLRSYTNNAPKICNTINIIAEDDNYSVYDEDMNIMAYIKNYDDTLLDIVLNIAPNKIYIYNCEHFSSKSLLDNILAIFKEKVVLQPM